jgi:hypothetical protein
MNRVLTVILVMLFFSGCGQKDGSAKRVAVARAGDATLYLDEIPIEMIEGISGADSAVFVQNYINKWAKKN